MEVVCVEKNHLIFYLPHDKFLALSFLTPPKKNPGVSIVIIKLSIKKTST